MASPMRLLGGFTVVFLGAFASLANAAAPPPQILNVDLEPGIRASAMRPERFAVDVPASASIQTDGAWSRANGVSTWRHALRIPTAVSMSFHARTLVLPAGATLRVTAGTASVIYRQADASAAGLWGRVLKGDTLAFEISVPTPREADVAFDITSLQAGYRGLGGGVEDHPAFKKLRAMNAIASAASCIENFSCHETAGNFGPRNATAAIVVAGVALCTATLINNVREDVKPYLLSARHCQVAGSGDSSIAVYWDGVVPCTAALGSVYDTLTPVHLGGHTVVEQQDVWLIDFQRELDSTHPYFAGWDATGGMFVGGYSPHHAEGRSRQYAGWFGQPVLHEISNSALGSGYRGSFWGVVNEIGSIGGGASGGGLFDPNNRLVGTASLALLAGEGGDGKCPVSSPPAPSATNTVAEYNSFAAVWDSTADTTSTTNPKTLKSVLDPDNTGKKVLDGFELLKGVFISTNAGNIFTGNPLTITWNAPGATSCTPEGGRVGDSWGGVLIPTSGSKQITEEDGGDVDYAIRCTDGTRKGYASFRMTWTESTPNASLFANPSHDVLIGRTSRFSWFSNVKNCVGSGGAPGDGWAGAKGQNGPFDVLMTEIGTHTYTLTCTSGTHVATSTISVDTSPPYAYLFAFGLMDNLRVGQSVELGWAGVPDCVRSGGSPGDGWADPTPMNIPQNTDAHRTVVPTVPGTYTFTITCSGGGQSAVASTTLTFNDLAPYVNVVATPNTSSVGWFASNGVFRQAGTPVQISWTSNLPNCLVHYTGPAGIAGDLNTWQQLFNVGNVFDTREVIGQYTYSVSCSGSAQTAVGSATVDWTTPQQSIRIWVPPTVVLNQGFPVSWESNVQPCTGVLGIPGDGWAGAKAGASGTSSAVVPVGTPAGTYTYRIECGGVAAETTTAVPAPTVDVISNFDHLQVGFSATVDWAATIGPCVLTSNPANVSWTGTQYASGRAFIGVSNPGPVTLTATCGPAGAQISKSTTITFDPSPTLNWTFIASKLTANINELVTLTWSSTSDYCSASADTTVNDWSGGKNGSGTTQISRPIPGTVNYRLMCNNIGQRDVTITFVGPSDAPNPFIPPTIALTASHTQRLTGEMVTLTWNSTHASECTAAGGTAGDGWTGSLSLSASQTVTETTAGNYNYFVTCSGAPPSAQAMVTVQFNAPAATGGNSGGANAGGGGGKGGGGRIDWLMLVLLGAITLLQAARVRRARA